MECQHSATLPSSYLPEAGKIAAQLAWECASTHARFQVCADPNDEIIHWCASMAVGIARSCVFGRDVGTLPSSGPPPSSVSCALRLALVLCVDTCVAQSWARASWFATQAPAVLQPARLREFELAMRRLCARSKLALVAHYGVSRDGKRESRTFGRANTHDPVLGSPRRSDAHRGADDSEDDFAQGVPGQLHHRRYDGEEAGISGGQGSSSESSVAGSNDELFADLQDGTGAPSSAIVAGVSVPGVEYNNTVSVIASACAQLASQREHRRRDASGGDAAGGDAAEGDQACPVDDLVPLGLSGACILACGADGGFGMELGEGLGEGGEYRCSGVGVRSLTAVLCSCLCGVLRCSRCALGYSCSAM